MSEATSIEKKEGPRRGVRWDVAMVAGDDAQAKTWLKIIADAGQRGFRRGRVVFMRGNDPAVSQAIDKDHRRTLKRESAKRRRQRELATPSQLSNWAWQKCKADWNQTCAYCGLRPKRLTQDHFIPLTDPECPGKVPWNIVPACPSCNASKGNRDPFEWFNNHRTKVIKRSVKPPSIKSRFVCRRHQRHVCNACSEKWRKMVRVEWDHAEYNTAYASMFETIRSIVMGEKWRRRLLSSHDGEARLGFTKKRLDAIVTFLNGFKKKPARTGHANFALSCYVIDLRNLVQL